MPARLQGFDHRLFLVRCHPADDGAFLEHGAERAGVLRQVPRVDGVAGLGHARARRDGAHGARAVPGDHLERHALRREVGDGLGGVGSQPLREQDKGDRAQARRQRLAVQGAVRVRQREDAPPAGGQVCGS